MTDTATPRASTGRLTVNPGDTIASVWGNTTFDQTAQVYDNAAARDAQWPTPHDGALCYTVDAQVMWLRKAGAWVALVPVPPAQAAGNAGLVFPGSATSSGVTTVTFPAGRFSVAPIGVILTVGPTTANIWACVTVNGAASFQMRGYCTVAVGASTIGCYWYATATT
jgi:hypothetical protein